MSITTTLAQTQDGTTIYLTSTAVQVNTAVAPAATDSPATQTDNKGSSNTFHSKGVPAIATIVPVVGCALIAFFLYWLWKRHRANKLAEEERRKEVEEYAFNPNNDPSMSMAQDDSLGYRGWGTTSLGRNPSTNPSGGMTQSDSGSGPRHGASPSDDTTQFSDARDRPQSTEMESVGALAGSASAAAPIAAANRNSGINRGPSNASSAYSAANRSETSEESRGSPAHHSTPLYGGNPYYSDVQNAYGPFGDHAAAQPVIRDVQARRNTRIESPSVFPRQGNAGIAQNF